MNEQDTEKHREKVNGQHWITRANPFNKGP